MNLKLKKVYTVSKKGKPEKPRLFLQHLVCEAAGGQSGDRLTYLCILTNAGLGVDYCRRYQQLRLYVDNEVIKFKNLNTK